MSKAVVSLSVLAYIYIIQLLFKRISCSLDFVAILRWCPWQRGGLKVQVNKLAHSQMVKEISRLWPWVLIYLLLVRPSIVVAQSNLSYFSFYGSELCWPDLKHRPAGIVANCKRLWFTPYTDLILVLVFRDSGLLIFLSRHHVRRCNISLLIVLITGSIREFCSLDMPIFMYDKSDQYIVKTLEEVSFYYVTFILHISCADKKIRQLS